MTKKIFAMFLAVLMVVSMLPTTVFAANCPGTGNHTAKNCNNTVIGVTEPTCKVDGFTAYRCEDCKEEFHDNVTPATGAHTYVPADDKAPTCEEEGKKGLEVCSGCGDEKAVTIVPSLSKGEYNCQWEITNPQVDCLTGGEQIWKCVNCGAEKTVKVEKKATHSFNAYEVVVKATKDVPGKAVRTCACGKTEEIKVYFDHNCKDHLITIEGYEKTCTTDGRAEHTECRICGTKYNAAGSNKLNATQIANLTLKAGHTFMKDGALYTPTCADTLLQCSVETCGQWVNPGVEHEIDWVVTADDKAKNDKAEHVAASCLKPGHIYDVCANCNELRLQTLPALGHKPVEVKGNATCSTLSYSFVYCTRTGCDAPVVNTTDYQTVLADERYDLTVHKFNFNENAPVVGSEYYMALNHMYVGTVLYFVGEASGDYLVTSNDVAKAVVVKTEKVHVLDTKGEVYLYFVNEEGVKTYIEIYKKDDGKVKVRLTAEKPENVYTWNAEYKVLTTKIDSNEYFLNCYVNDGVTYETIGASKLTYAPKTEAATNTTFRASLVSVNETAVPHIISFTLNKTAGVDSAAHPAWNTEVVTAATCTTNGLKVVNCVFCGSTHQEEIPAAHSWVNATDDQVPGKTEKAAQTVGCNDGWQWKICSVTNCGATKKVVTAGSGHVYADVVKFVPDHNTTTGYDTKTCVYCDVNTEGHVVKLTYRVWEYVGVQFEDLTKAQAAHGASNLSNPKVLSVGNCSQTGLTRYSCTCGKDVLVKTEGKHLAPTEINGVAVHQDPTCTEKGWDLTYTCQRVNNGKVCGAVVGNAPVGEKNDIAALGHDHQPAEDHECSGCEKPDYTKVHKTCTRCDDKIYCYVAVPEMTNKVTSGNDLCDTPVYEYYWCEACQDYHFRNYVKAMGHDWVAVTDDEGNIIYITDENGMVQAPTCTKTGLYTEKCAICGDEREQVAPVVPHKNKAGDDIINNCQSKVTDRHCVNCCTCGAMGSAHKCETNKVGNTVKPCDCVIKAECQYDEVLMPSTCSMKPYIAKTCPDCGDRTNEVQNTADVYKWVNTAAEGEEANFEWVLFTNEQIIFKGHKPAAIDKINKVVDGKLTDELVEVKYPGFTYEEYTHVWYTVVDGQLYENTETYTAKFIERKAASYTEEGYDFFVCAICKTEEKNVKAKLTGLGFQFDVKNTLGGKEFTYGSLIEVIVYANGNNADVHGFNFDVSVGNATAGAKFVGYEKLNDDFNLVVTDPSKTTAKATVSGFAANTASGKQQNITINGKTELVKLYFRIADKAFVTAATLTAKFQPVANQPMVTVLEDGASVDVTANTNILSKDFNTRGFLDFNKDTAANTKDLQMAMSMITLEHVNGKTYDVTVDINKDGVVDLEDLSIAYNYVVGNYDVEDLLVMGISEAEVVLLDLNEKFICVNPHCGYELDSSWNKCPMCGNTYN